MKCNKEIKTRRKGKIMTIVLCVILVPIITLFMLSPGKLSQFTDDKGKVIKNSISEKTFVDINGVKMGMIIKSKDISNPVLLFVHGGPGMPEYFLNQDYPTGLENYFTVVWWDQRGAGLSYNRNISDDEMNYNQFVDDTIGVTNYLRKRFEQDKIYLMAHSFGSSVGIKTVKKAPQLYKAYIGIGQITYQPESEKLAYEYMLNYYEKIGDVKTLKKLKDMPYGSDKYSRIRDSVMHRAGIGTTHNMDSVVKDIFFRSLANKEYTFTEKINLWRGKIFSGSSAIKDEEHSIDFRKEIQSLDIPVYFLSGQYDYTVNYKMTQDYLKVLKAPVKGFYLFENSAHSPIFEEIEKTAYIMKNDILKLENNNAYIK